MFFYTELPIIKTIQMTIYDPSKSEIAYANFTHFILRIYYKQLVKSLELQPDDKVIDFGSGTGFVAKLMSKKLVGQDSWISCVEISEKWNNVARKKLRRYPNVDFFCGMMYELDMKENYYDKILVHWVLHDVPKEHREKIVKSMSKRLKKGGVIILREFVGSHHGMPESEIRELMTKAGMIEVKSKMVKHRIVGTTMYATFEKK